MIDIRRHWPTLVRTAAILAVAGAAGCRSEAATASEDGVATEPVYSRSTGRLEQLKADANGDGKTDTIAFMDGTTLKSIEVDHDQDGKPDRWETYGPGTTAQGSNAFDRWAVIERADEGHGPDGKPTRHEFYERGVISRVEEDTDDDGRVDKWEFYGPAGVARVDLDLGRKGFPSTRLIYGSDGNVVRIEQDSDGDGRFQPVTGSATK